jgi:hypothetical protein
VLVAARTDERVPVECTLDLRWSEGRDVPRVERGRRRGSGDDHGAADWGVPRSEYGETAMRAQNRDSGLTLALRGREPGGTVESKVSSAPYLLSREDQLRETRLKQG